MILPIGLNLVTPKYSRIASQKVGSNHCVNFASSDTLEIKENKKTGVYGKAAVLGLAVVGGCVLALKRKKVKYPADVEYRKSLLREMNLPENEYKQLRSIIGCEELNAVTKAADKENYLPGIKAYRANKEAFFPERGNVKSGKFLANLHTHTIYSDGKFTIAELLEQGAKYGDERVAKLGKGNPFYLAITDHDTLEGCKEAVEIVKNNPEKYKNLRLVLGIENSAQVDSPDLLKGPVHVHMITYGINPFDKELNNLIQQKIDINKRNIEKVLSVANTEFGSTLDKFGLNYNYQDLVKMVPAIGCGIKSVGFYHKDYMQFRLIYSAAVEKNKELSKYLESQNIKMDFTTPIDMIEKNPDYSKGQKYYDYYFKAIKTHIKSQVPESDYKFVDEKLKNIPSEIVPTLNRLEEKIMQSAPEYKIPATEYYTFENLVKFYAGKKHGQMGIAHPGVVFPYANLKDEGSTLRFYDELYRDFKAWGGEKAVYAEDNYGVYYKENENLHNKLEQVSAKYGLQKIGGLDTHIKDIFASK